MIKSIKFLSSFDRIIRTSPALIKKLKYSVIVTKKKKNIKTIDDLPGAHYQVQKIFGVDDSSYGKYREKIIKHSSTVKNLTIVETEMSSQLWPSFLNHFANVTHLTLVDVKFEIAQTETLSLSHVKYLEVVGGSIYGGDFCEIFKISKVIGTCENE
jgi:hypothetical protein